VFRCIGFTLLRVEESWDSDKTKSIKIIKIMAAISSSDVKKSVASVTIVVVLGNSEQEIYEARANRALQIVDQNMAALLLAKFYRVIPVDQQYFVDRMSDKSRLWADKQSLIYRLSKYTFDTITEAVGCRCLLELRFSPQVERDPSFCLNLIVVTSACHEERTRWIFSDAFCDVDWISLSFDSSETTSSEVQANRVEIEAQILVRQRRRIGTGAHGGIANFINDQRQRFPEKYLFEFRDREPLEASTYRSKFQVVFHPFVEGK
jgi:hypothetical protein